MVVSLKHIIVGFLADKAKGKDVTRIFELIPISITYYITPSIFKQDQERRTNVEAKNRSMSTL